MPYRKEIYPYVDDKDVRRIRRKKKEDLVAYICFLAKRNDIFDGATKELVRAAVDSDMSHEDFRILFVETLNKIFMSNLHLMKKYHRFVDEIDVPTQVVVHQVNLIDEDETCEGCDSCKPQYDTKDINVN